MKTPHAEDIIVVDILEKVVQATSVETGMNINYVYGQSLQILDELERKNNVLFIVC